MAHLEALAALRPLALSVWAPTERRRTLAESAGALFLTGSLEDALRGFSPSHVVIASPIDTLTSTAICVLAAGVSNVLIEKPAAVTLAESERLVAAAAAGKARVCVAYNRRFYASVRTALTRMRERRERIVSVLFEFNESMPDGSGPIGHSSGVCERWLIANSLHVIDLALFSVGRPDLSRSLFLQAGALPWHPSGSVFAGAGITEQNVLFSYHANWCGPGRWGVEWVTASERYVFRPLEELAVIPCGGLAPEKVPLIDDLDKRFKPGVFLQDKAFIEGVGDAELPSLSDASALVRLGTAIGGYSA